MRGSWVQREHTRPVYKSSFVPHILYTKRPVYKTSFYIKYGYKMTLEVRITKCPFTKHTFFDFTSKDVIFNILRISSQNL